MVRATQPGEPKVTTFRATSHRNRGSNWGSLTSHHCASLIDSAPVCCESSPQARKGCKVSRRFFHAILPLCALDFDDAAALSRSGIFVCRCLHQCWICTASSAGLCATGVPEPGLMWTPGYWGYGPMATIGFPEPGCPRHIRRAMDSGYWGWSGGLYVFMVAIGVPRWLLRRRDYGFGYMGVGFAGGCGAAERSRITVRSCT